MDARLPLLAGALWLLSGCGKELGRVPFEDVGRGSTTVTLAAGDVDFWTDLKIEYEGAASLGYEIELFQDGASVATATCNPLGSMTVKTSWVETNIGGSHSRRGNGKMGCSVNLPKGGATKVKASLAFGTKPSGLVLSKADLVIKQ